MFPRLYNAADLDDCIELFLNAYESCGGRWLSPPQDVVASYLKKMIERPNASVFVYEVHDKPFSVCCGVTLTERSESGAMVKRFYIEDLFSDRRTQKQVPAADRLLRFAKKVLLQNDVFLIEDKKDFCQCRADAFRKLGFDPALNEKVKLCRKYKNISKSWAKINNALATLPVPPLPDLFYLPLGEQEIHYSPFILSTRPLGSIRITSGIIVADDLFHSIPLPQPLAYRFPVGEFPVELLIAKKENGFEKTAAALIKFSVEPVASWELILPMGKHPEKIAQDDLYRYKVKSGKGWFSDLDALKSVRTHAANELAYYKRFRTSSGALFKVDDMNVFIFSTGFGNGHYLAYIGKDHQGNLCRLMSEFELFTKDEYGELLAVAGQQEYHAQHH